MGRFAPFLILFWYFGYKITKNFEIFKNSAPKNDICICRRKAVSLHKISLMAHRIKYYFPVEWLSGNLSGRQFLAYGEDDTKAYACPDGANAATNYQPRLIAAIRERKNVRYYMVRTSSTTNWTVNSRLSVAALGGAGAIYSAIVRDKTSAIYKAFADVLQASGETTLRKMIVPPLVDMLSQRLQSVTIEGVTVTNPWVYSGTQTVTISQTIIDKFKSVLQV